MALLYHEPQVASLCGVHALNTLLQGAWFTEIELATIAQELDAKERQLMMESGIDSDDFLKYVAEDSGNVAADGNFSIQVLSKALEAWSLECIPLDSPDAGPASREPDKEVAFLCNLREHWFAIRKLREEWFNFNSLYPAPELLSQFYLGAYLSSLKAEGYTIFVVRGGFPAVNPGEPSASGRWLSKEDAEQLIKSAGTERQRAVLRKTAESAMARAQAGQSLVFNPAASSSSTGPMTLDADDEEAEQMRAAIAASLGHEGGGGQAAMGTALTEHEALARAIAESLQGAGTNDARAGLKRRLTAQVVQHNLRVVLYQKRGAVEQTTLTSAGLETEPEMDPELAAAIAASLQPSAESAAESALPEETTAIPPEPQAGDGVVQLAIRLPSGDRMVRRFTTSTPIKVVVACIQERGVSMAGMALETVYPRAQLPSGDTTLLDAGVVGQTMLNIVQRA